MSNTENKKVSLADQIKQSLENKKKALADGKQSGKWANTNQTMKSQQTKKINNQKKRRGI